MKSPLTPKEQAMCDRAASAFPLVYNRQPAPAPLTERQAAIVKRINAGESQRSIAAALGVHPQTICNVAGAARAKGHHVRKGAPR